MNGKITSLPSLSLSLFTLYHHVLFSLSCCFTPHSPFIFLTFICPSVASVTPLHLPSSWIPPLPFILLSCTFLPPAKPSFSPSFPSFNSSIPPPLSVLWWGAGWPWIPLLLWGNNRRSLLFCVPLSPTWGPQSAGKEGARKRENTSWVCGREGEWEREVLKQQQRNNS